MSVGFSAEGDGCVDCVQPAHSRHSGGIETNCGDFGESPEPHREPAIAETKSVPERNGKPDLTRPRDHVRECQRREAHVLRGLDTPLPRLSFEYLPAARHVAHECLDPLTAIGDYRYNWSPGESHRLASPEGSAADGIRRFVDDLSLGDGSVDTCARLNRT